MSSEHRQFETSIMCNRCGKERRPLILDYDSLLDDLASPDDSEDVKRELEIESFILKCTSCSFLYELVRERELINDHVVSEWSKKLLSVNEGEPFSPRLYVPATSVVDLLSQSMVVLECEESIRQGTGFRVEGIGYITCAHVIGPQTRAFHHSNPNYKVSITVVHIDREIDLAIFTIMEPLTRIHELKVGTAELTQMAQITIGGFPNYRNGDSPRVVAGYVPQFRVVSGGIRRYLSSEPIIVGNSGGPVLNNQNQVVGIAANGADDLGMGQETEDHSIIPIQAIKFLQA